MLRGYEENECPYSESDAPEILHKLLKKALIELRESRRPEKIRRTNDPKYYKYHKIISNPIEKCKALNGQVQQLTKEGKIALDEEDTKEFD